MTPSHGSNLRIRAATSPSSPVGRERFNLYKPAFARISKAMEGGFYVDAICILESLITDRLESYFRSEHNLNYSFSTLGFLINAFNRRDITPDSVLRLLVVERLDVWRAQRNKAVHEMVKLDDGELLRWEKRLELSEDAARKGLILFREIDGRIRKIRSDKIKKNVENQH